MDIQPPDAAPAAPAPTVAPVAGSAPRELVELAPFVVLIACLVARHFGVAQGEVEPIELVACLLIDPRRGAR